MCDCSNNSPTNKYVECELDKIIPKTSECECEYLKPLTIDSLFERDLCTDYKTALEKAKKLRNAFFAAKASVYNFVTDCDELADSLLSDMSDNEIELQGVKDQYLATVNGLISSLYASLKITYDTKALVNVDISKVSMGEAQRPQKSTDLRVRSDECSDPISLTHIPGVQLVFNKSSKMLRIKFSEPANVSGLTKHGNLRKEKDVTKSFILTPNIFCTEDYNLFLEDLSKNGLSKCDLSAGGVQQSDLSNNKFTIPLESNKDVFQNLDIARDFFEEFQNYQDLHVLDADMSYGNQILEVMNYFDKTIAKIEAVHKYIVQLCKINTGN